MTPERLSRPLSGLRRHRAASVLVAAMLWTAPAAVAPSAAVAAPAPVPARSAVVPLSASLHSVDDKLAGDDGRRSFGVQPSGPKKPDARPNLTYQNVKPGARLFDRVAILNISDKPVTLSVYAADAFNTPEGAFDVRKAGERSKDLGSWVKLLRTTVRVPARSAFITPIELNVPKNAEPGDHAAAIVASLRSQSRDKKGNVVNRDDRVGTRLYVRVAGELRPQIALERNDASYQQGSVPVARGRAQVTYTVRNTGNVRLVGRQTVRVTNLIGGSAQAIDVPELPELLPGNEFSFTRPVDKVVPTFLNTAHVVLDPESVAGNVDPALAQVTASTRFLAISWPAVVVLLLLAAAGARYWWRRRRRAEAGPTQWDGGGPGAEPGPGSGGGGSQAVTPAPAPQRAGVSPRLRILVAGLLGVLAVLLPAAAPAHAEGGSLTFIPGKATAGTPIYVVTSAACPKEATNVIGLLFGQGMPAEGKVVIPNQDTPIRYDGSFGVGMQDNLLNFAREEGATLSGPYKVSLRCVDQFLLKTYAEFTGTVTFDRPTDFTAPVPAKPPVDGVPEGYLSLVFPGYRKALEANAAPGPQGQNPAPAPSPAPSPAASADAAAAPAVNDAREESGGFSASAIRPFLIALAVVALLGGAAYLWTRRGAGPGGGRTGSPPVEWPDEAESRTALASREKR